MPSPRGPCPTSTRAHGSKPRSSINLTYSSSTSTPSQSRLLTLRRSRSTALTRRRPANARLPSDHDLRGTGQACDYKADQRRKTHVGGKQLKAVVASAIVVRLAISSAPDRRAALVAAVDLALSPNVRPAGTGRVQALCVGDYRVLCGVNTGRLADNLGRV